MKPSRRHRPGTRRAKPFPGIWVCAPVAGLTVLLSIDPAFASIPEETRFVLNSFSFLIHGFLIFWMAAGFSMLEAGLVRTKSVTTILIKNITLFAIAGVAFYATGYNLMFTDVDGGFLGTFGPWRRNDEAALAGDLAAGSASTSVWFFQMLFAATASSIVSGALAERIKLWPFFLFIAVLAALIYPIQGSWSWGGGWLAEFGFKDFAGATHVHAAAGCAALTGIYFLGPRRGRFGAEGKEVPIPGSSLPLATLGTMILWLGWFGFNGGSVGSLASPEDVIAMSNVYANTTMASAAGILTVVIFSQLKFGRVDLAMVLNGALAGLVSITGGPEMPTIPQAMAIGAVGALLMVSATWLLSQLRLDDVVGAVPVHLACGIWGTLAVPIANPETDLGTQVMGILSVCVFSLAATAILWLAIKKGIGLRLSQAEEAIGIDKVETGALAYPEFTLNNAFERK